MMSLFCGVLERSSAEERAAYLEAACGPDRELRARMEALLRAHEQAGGFLGQRRDAGEPRATIDEVPITEQPGTVIGAYKLLEQIGEGGFGVVFMAEQQQPIRRKVALKVLKPGMDTKQVVARFEAERQALALMDHPNIAKVLDGGQTTSGRPYFVMDLVKGLPITQYCDQQQLTARERLELFVNVCQAVQHAHQKGIIHRDLKPSNVLVTLNDGAPLVKVIDFGVAKALGQQLTDRTLFTGFAQLIGTPLYMSPEQAALSNVDVDTRSDIYSLGVLLYELLTGTTPFQKERFQEADYDEIRRIIREEEPPKPSTRISTLGQAATTASTQRKSDPKRLSQLFRGELDWIVMKALEKDRGRRYESASAFAADVHRYLHDEPVLACPPSAWYRFRKLARRKKTTLAMVACVLLALAGIAGAVGWAIGDKGAREEGIRVAQQAREKALDDAVQQTLDETGPLIELGKWPEAVAVVERADKLLAAAGRTERPGRLVELQRELAMAQRLEEIYRTPRRKPKANLLIPGDPGTVVRSRTPPDAAEEEFFRGREQDAEFTRAFREFGIAIDSLAPAEAAAQIGPRRIRSALVKALDDWASLRNRARGDNDPGWKKLIKIARLADPDIWRNRCREALLRRDRQKLEQLAATVPIRRVPPTTLWQLGTALLQVGARDKAMDLLKRAQHEYPSDLLINDALAWFSWTAYQPPRYDDALRFYTAVLAVRPRLASVHEAVAKIFEAKGGLNQALAEYSMAIELEPRNTLLWHSRGSVHYYLREYPHALADFTKALELDLKNTAAWRWRGWVYMQLQQHDKAIADFSKAIALDPKDAAAWNNRGYAYKQLHRYDKAIADLSKAIALDPKSSTVWQNRGSAYYDLHQYDKAIADFSKAIELDPNNGAALNDRGLTYAELKKWEEASADYARATELDPNHANRWSCRALLRLGAGDRKGYRQICATMLERFGKSEDGATAYYVVWTCVLTPEAVADPARPVQLAAKAVAKAPDNRAYLNTLGAALYRAGRLNEAAKLLSKANAGKLRADQTAVYTWLFLAMTRHGLGHADEARRWLAKAVQAIDQAAKQPAKPAAGPSGKTNQTRAASPLPWNLGLELQLLRREAEERLGVKKQKN
jgi:serine/threonine protein kinase/Flp pilus assembly protein TadD